MKWFGRWPRIFLLFLLSLTVFAPIVFLSDKLKSLSSEGRRAFVEDFSATIHRQDALPLNLVSQEGGEGLKEPNSVVYRDRNYSTVGSNQNVGDGTTNPEDPRGNEGSAGEESKLIQVSGDSLTRNPKEGQTSQISRKRDLGLRAPPLAQNGRDTHKSAQRATDEKVKQMKDQVIRAKAYLSFATSSGNTHLVKELRLRMKEVERAVGEVRKDSELSRSALQKMKYMESTLSKASHIYPDCSKMADRLRAMTHTAEAQVQSQRNQTTFLTEIAGRTTPKGLHCLSMRLTTEYFALQPEQQVLPNQQNVDNLDLFHYVVFSDNVLAAAVIVNSTVAIAMEPEKIVFHVVTDSLNYFAISMWFLLNPPEKATIEVLSTKDFQWLSSSSLEKQKSHDHRYSSVLNHLRFYLPEIFPQLNKIVFLDHDVVVQKDLSKLFTIDMKGKVNGAVETSQEGDSSYRRMDTFINFSDPIIASNFDANTCTWAFGMNVFDLKQWRLKDLTSSYRRFLLTGDGRPLWTAGSLPLGWLTFYDQTVPLDRRWHLLGLGYDSQMKSADIEQAAVIHYDGIMKPWLDIGIKKYKDLWNKYVDYRHPFLQSCNLHGSG